MMNSETSGNQGLARTAPGPSPPLASNDGTTRSATNTTSSTSRQQLRSSLQTADRDWAEVTDSFQANIAEPGRKALHDFFYPSRQSGSFEQASSRDSVDAYQAQRPSTDTPSTIGRQAPQAATHQDDRLPPPSILETPTTPRQTVPIEQEPDILEQERQDKAFIEDFWTIYDDIIILSLFTQIGILCRLGTAYCFRFFDSVFRQGSALFTNLPLNCFSCFVMGLLCSGESLMEIVSTRFTPPRLQHDLHQEARSLLAENGDEEDVVDMPDSPSLASQRWEGTPGRRRRKKTPVRASGWRPQTNDFHNELREVQLLALERRIRASPCLVLFHVKKVDGDVVENYFNEGYRNKNLPNGEEKEDGEDSDNGDGDRFSLDEHDLVLEETEGPSTSRSGVAMKGPSPLNSQDQGDATVMQETPKKRVRLQLRNYAQIEQGDGQNPPTEGNSEAVAQPSDLEQIVSNVATDVSEQISRISRVSLADGWDVGTTPEDKKKDLMLGLRDGLCGALSSFSSWVSAMVTLFRAGNIGEAFIGLVLGIQLPLVAYRFGQHVAVYLFVWRCRRETRRDERRGGYGIRLSMDEDGSEELAPDSLNQSNEAAGDGLERTEEEEPEAPSVRAIITALFVLALVAQVTSLSFYYEPEDRLLALSLLFSPLGVLARWRLSRLNSWRPSFPIGTFACNVSACALSGTLGSLLAGNPGPRERIALVALIAGMGGTLSSVARFIVEVLAGVDPILLRIDGVYYAIISVTCGLLVSFVFTGSVDWADSTE